MSTSPLTPNLSLDMIRLITDPDTGLTLSAAGVIQLHQIVIYCKTNLSISKLNFHRARGRYVPHRPNLLCTIQSDFSPCQPHWPQHYVSSLIHPL
jgi:hypothetical protein